MFSCSGGSKRSGGSRLMTATVRSPTAVSQHRPGTANRTTPRPSLVADDLDAHLGQAVRQHPELARGATRQVDDPTLAVGPAIVDAHRDAPVVLEVRHL